MAKANETISTFQKTLEAKNEALREEELRLTQQLANNQKRHEALMKELTSPVIAVQSAVAGDVAMKVNRFQQVVSRSLLKGGMKIKTAFDEYELIAQIGQGGCGRVFSAKNSDGEMFAIKFLDKHIGRTKLKRFKNEINFCEHSSHVNIVKVVDRGCVELENNVEYIFCVMPLYEQSLRDKMRAGVQHQTAVDIFLGLLQGLQYAHRRGLIHRDIKPENIMFAKDSTVPVICDFGIAHFSEENMETTIVTKPTDRLANFQYSAPEQREKGGVATPQTDIFSLGLILNEMFTQSVPQGLGYKTIQSVAPEYDYLDDLFAKLYRQNPNERLYPEQKIMIELRVLAEAKGNREQIRSLNAMTQDAELPEIQPMEMIDKRYQNNSIVFVMNQDVPYDWFTIMQGGSFSHTSVLGFDSNTLVMHGKREIVMPMRHDSDMSTIRDSVGYFKEWVQIVNALYIGKLKNEVGLRQHKAEQLRKSEIAKLERETAIKKMLSQI